MNALVVIMNIMEFVNLQSFADQRCSGRSQCEFHVIDLVKSEIRPCPLELSSYLEGSHICIPGDLN